MTEPGEVTDYAKGAAETLDGRALNNDKIAFQWVAVCLADRFPFLDRETRYRIAHEVVTDERQRRKSLP